MAQAPLSNATALEYLYLAVQAQYGIKLRTDRPEFVRTKLYAVRRETPDPVLGNLTFICYPGEIWIVKKEATNGSPQD